MALLTIPVARALVADLLDAMQPADAVIVLEQLRRRYEPRTLPPLCDTFCLDGTKDVCGELGGCRRAYNRARADRLATR